MKHDLACEAGQHQGSLEAVCHCAERAYARDPFVLDDEAVLMPIGG